MGKDELLVVEGTAGTAGMVGEEADKVMGVGMAGIVGEAVGKVVKMDIAGVAGEDADKVVSSRPGLSQPDQGGTLELRAKELAAVI